MRRLEKEEPEEGGGEGRESESPSRLLLAAKPQALVLPNTSYMHWEQM